MARNVEFTPISSGRLVSPPKKSLELEEKIRAAQVDYDCSGEAQLIAWINSAVAVAYPQGEDMLVLVWQEDSMRGFPTRATSAHEAYWSDEPDEYMVYASDCTDPDTGESITSMEFLQNVGLPVSGND